MNHTLPAACLIALAISSGCGESAAKPADSASSLQSLQLRTSDVPADFYLEAQYYLNPRQTAQWQNLSRSEYDRNGGGSSLAYTFALRHPVGEGMTLISSQVIAFTSAGSAVQGFRELRAALDDSGTIGTVQEHVNVGATPTPLPTIIKIIKHPVPPPVARYQAIAVPSVGLQDAGFTNTSAAYAGEFVFTNQVVLFRQGRYCAIVHTSGNYNQVPVSTAVSLARRMNAYIRAAKT
jgi:hypothetical protein